MWKAGAILVQADPWDEPDPRPAQSRPARRGAGVRPGESAGRRDAARRPGHVNDDIDLDEMDPHGRAQRAWAKRAGSRRTSRKSTAKQATKWTAIGLCLALLAARAASSVYVYETDRRLDQAARALAPNGMTAGRAAADPYGNTRAEHPAHRLGHRATAPTARSAATARRRTADTPAPTPTPR